MTEKPTTTKRKIIPAKPSSAARKLTTAKSPAKEERMDKKNKAENKKKVVRDSFTMPPADYAKIGEFKQALLKAGVHVKKNQLLRAGLHALGRLSAAQLKQAIARVEQVKTGRQKKS